MMSGFPFFLWQVQRTGLSSFYTQIYTAAQVLLNRFQYFHCLFLMCFASAGTGAKVLRLCRLAAAEAGHKKPRSPPHTLRALGSPPGSQARTCRRFQKPPTRFPPGRRLRPSTPMMNTTAAGRLVLLVCDPPLVNTYSLIETTAPSGAAVRCSAVYPCLCQLGLQQLILCYGRVFGWGMKVIDGTQIEHASCSCLASSRSCMQLHLQNSCAEQLISVS